eukprot:TRINITY_DN1378_c0_g3_i1.p1 TRINITY_DN1378_c0_g3~~TRINITY_DN1378_c0_g3_i1.p1  ORF type:complete len:549 (-),score=135.43 TRINITY_DN1378_c0_g3_i1:134-1780(-)
MEPPTTIGTSSLKVPSANATVRTRPPSTELKPLAAAITSAKDVKYVKTPVEHVRYRDRTKEYQERRVEYRDKSEKDLNSMLEMLAKLSLQKFTNSKESIVPKPKGPTIQKCARCEEGFEWSWWNLKEMRNVCTLCGKTFCNNCGTSKVQLKFVAANEGDDKSEVQACIGCSEIVQSYYRKIQFEELRRTAELNPVVNFYRDTTSLKAQAFFLIDRYADVTSALSMIDASRFEQANTVLENVIAASQVPLVAAGSSVSVSESIITSSTKFLKYLLPIGGFGPSPPPPLVSSQSTREILPSKVSPSPSLSDMKPKNASSQALAPPSSTPTGDEPSADVIVKKQSLPNESPEALYKMADNLEKDITKTLMTYNRCVKEMSEIVVDSVQENEIIKHIKNASAMNIQEIALSLKMLKKRIVQIDFRLLKTIYNTLFRISRDLTSYAFCGVLKEPIDRCLEKITEELKSKVESISEPWDVFESDLREEAMSCCSGSSTKIINLPTNASVKLQAQKVIGIVTQLSNMAQFSIAHDYIPQTISSISTLLKEAQQYG